MSAVSALRIGSSISRVRLAQMLDRGLAVNVRLGGAELDEQFDALAPGRRLGERAAKVGDSALGRAARARSAGRARSVPRPPGSVAGGLRNRCAATRSGSAPASSSELAARPCPLVSLERGERFVDGRADQRVHEAERGRGRSTSTRASASSASRDAVGSSSPASAAAWRGSASSPRIATARASARRLARKARQGEATTAREPARAASSRKRDHVDAGRGEALAAMISCTSSRNSSGLPPVSARQAAQNASSASGDRASRSKLSGRLGAQRGGPEDRGQRVGQGSGRRAPILPGLLGPQADDHRARRALPSGAAGRPASATTRDRTSAGRHDRQQQRTAPARFAVSQYSPCSVAKRGVSAPARPRPGRGQTASPRAPPRPPANRLAPRPTGRRATARTAAGRRRRRTSARALTPGR